ncbi:MBOAT family protein [Leptospira sp. 96542]|nr:MBOAT family protein [Leptospira sp. 96542]
MLFNTFVFLIFFLSVYAIFLFFGWYAKKQKWALRAQNVWLLFASYFFYGWWEWFFLILILTSTIIDYVAARSIETAESQTKRRVYLAISVVANLGLLFTMKYYDFFASNLIDSWNHLVLFLGGTEATDSSTYLLRNIVLPVGISFYTFQTMSYTIDVYRKQIAAEKDFLDFALFVNYFPQLVAGPIERASDLLPQLKKPKFPTWEVLPLAFWDILLGYFMKVYVADNLAIFVDQVYLAGKSLYIQNPEIINNVDGSQVFVGGFAFLTQVYCDFAGYSFIALGTSRLLGVTLTVNFETPEYSKNPIEFWNRWHVTLNRWFRDYIFIALGGSKFGKLKQYRNLLLVFFLSGLWHGANWTFITWGCLQGVYTIAYLVFFSKKQEVKETNEVIGISAKLWSFVSGLSARFLVYTLVSFSAIAFRSYDASMMLLYFQKTLFVWDWNLNPANGIKGSWALFGEVFKICLPLFIIDGISYFKKERYWVYLTHPLVQAFVISFIGFLILTRGIFGKEVIYFAF